LEAHLEGCESCRLTREIGADFDAIEPAIDDGKRIERLAAFAAARPRWRLGRLSRGVLLAATLSLLSGVALAGYGWLEAHRAARGMLARAATSAARASVSAPLAWRVVEPQAPSAAPSNAAPLGDAAGPNEAASSAPPMPRAAAGAQSAAQLFRKANELRRAGESQQAIQAYRALQRDFAGSPEATLSQVSLGGLLLNRGSAQSALVEFDRYLRASRSGALAAEALYGRGRALQGLGRRADERKNWEQLLSQYPGCPYVESARRRLAELRD
jgi:TolA-binding protein